MHSNVFLTEILSCGFEWSEEMKGNSLHAVLPHNCWTGIVWENRKLRCSKYFEGLKMENVVLIIWIKKGSLHLHVSRCCCTPIAKKWRVPVWKFSPRPRISVVSAQWMKNPVWNMLIFFEGGGQQVHEYGKRLKIYLRIAKFYLWC